MKFVQPHETSRKLLFASWDLSLCKSSSPRLLYPYSPVHMLKTISPFLIGTQDIKNQPDHSFLSWMPKINTDMVIGFYLLGLPRARVSCMIRLLFQERWQSGRMRWFAKPVKI